MMPDPEKLRQQKVLGFLGERVFSSNLWHLNRRSVTGAVSIGLFMAFVPFPGQMILAAIGAIAIRVNLPISVAVVWITNPITIPPIFYSAYLLGHWLLNSHKPQVIAISGPWYSVFGYDTLWALLLGCLILATVSSTLGYIFTSMFWRLWVAHTWAKRKKQRAMQRNNVANVKHSDDEQRQDIS